MHAFPRTVASASLAALALGALGCPSRERNEPRALAAPRAVSAVRCSGGSPLAGGAVSRVDPGEAASALSVAVDLVALERLETDLLDPIGARARLVVCPLDETPLKGAPRLFAGARAGEPGDAFLAALEGGRAGRSARLAHLRGALPRGTTTAFEAVRDGACELGEETFHERFAVLLHRTPPATETGSEGLEVALELEDMHQEAPASGEPLRATRKPRREIVLLEVLPRATWSFAAIVPSPFDGDEPRAIAALVVISQAPRSGEPGALAHAEAFSACAGDLAREEACARARASAPHDGPRVAAATGHDLDGFLERKWRRRSILGLAEATGATLAGDVALSGRDELLDRIAGAFVESLGSDPGGELARLTLKKRGWFLERAALLELRELLAQEEVDPQVETLLVRRAGAVGRSGASLGDVLDRATGLEDLEDQLARENRVLLRDASPAVRARAHEWLLARGSAPSGFAPLDPPEARRAALDRAARERKEGSR